MESHKPTQDFPINDKKIINGWAMFDWANSSYALVITAAIFPAYFNSVTNTYNASGEVISKNVEFLGMTLKNSTLFSYSVSFGYLLIVLALPLLTGMSDYSGRKMYFMKRFTLLGSLSCILLFLFTGMSTLWIGVMGYILALIGFAGGQVFYNSYLPVIASEDQVDNVSAKGFVYGYVGSVILLVVNLAIIMNEAALGLEPGFGARMAFVMVGLWWLGFAQISFARLPKDNQRPVTKDILSKGYQEIKKVYAELQFLPNAKRFLLSYFFYISAALTVIMLAATFAEDELKMDTGKLIITILLIQIVAIAGAYLFAKLSELKGNKFALICIMFIWIAVCIAAYFVTEQSQFYGVAAVVGLVMGGVQSLSRSTYAKLIPEDTTDTASFFSFFDVLEKTGVVIGTFIFGYLGEQFGMRISVLSLILNFTIGTLILFSVKMPNRSAVKQG